jgi:hypothetical protein
MALLDFPTGPNPNDTTTQNGNTWKWNGTSWVAFNSLSLSSQVSGILAVQYGGTGFGTYTKGDILYALTSNTFGKLAAGTGGSILAIDNSGDLYWKKDDAGTGSVSAGTLGGFAFYDTANSITSGTAVSYIIGSGAGGTGATFVIKQSFMALIGSTITAGTWAGSAITLAYGGTNNTVSGIGHSYRIAMYDAAGTAITNIITSAGIANSVLFQSSFTSAPIWQGQSQLVVGGATTSANIQGGTQYNVVYQSNANTTGFVGNAAGSGASVLTQTGNNVPVYFSQSQLIVGGATTAANIQGGVASQLHYQTGANTTGFVSNAAGSGASILSQTGSAAPIYLGQAQLVVGGATTSANIQGGAASQILYQSGANATAFVSNAAGSGASILSQTGSAAPVYLGQAQLVVGGATTAANIQGGVASQLHYQTGANTTGFVSNAAGAGASVLTQTGSAAPTFFGQSQLVVGGATTSANIQGGAASQILYQSGANATAFVSNAAGSGASILSQTGSAAPVYLGQAQLVVGGATTSANIQGGATGSLPYQSGANATAFLSHPGSAGQALTTNSSNGLAWTALTNLAVTSVSAGTAIQVSANTGAVTITNNGVHSISGTSNRVTVSVSGSGGTGAVTLTTPQDIHTSASPQFADIILNGGSSTLTTVGSQPTSMVNKQYVDNLASGLDIHDSVRLVITSAIGASYYQPGYGIGNTATGAYLTSIGSSTFPAFDGVTIGSTGLLQRVLVTGGLTATGKTSINGSALVSPATLADSNLVNGIYYLGSVGSGSSQWYLYRAAETDDNTELTGGTFTFVEEGDLFKDTGWVCTNDTTNLGPIQFGSTVISFSQFTGAAAISFGQGLTRVGNTVASKINLSATGAASAIGFTQFNIGGPTVGGAADTGYYPTFSVRTGTIHAGTSLLTLNHTGFSLVGSTNTNATLTITGDISLPSPTQFGIAYGSSANAVAFLAAGGAGASVLTQTSGSNPVYFSQSQLVVGGATTSANIQGGSAGNIHYQSGSNATAFVTNAAGSGASILSQTGNAAPLFLGQAQLVVGGASTSANIQGGAASQLLYQSGANTTGFVGNAAGSGASILTQTGSAAPTFFGQSQLVVGGATTSANIQGGAASQILYQSGANTTGFVSNAAGSGASILTQTGSAAPTFFGQSQLVVGGATTSANIQGGAASQLLYQSGANATTFVANAAGSGASILTQTGSAAPTFFGQSQLVVGGATTSANIQGGAASQLLYQSGANATTFVANAAGSGASILTQTGSAAPTFFGQSQLVVGGATTSANIQGGAASQLLYQSGANATTFVANAAGSGASILTQTGSAAPVYLGQAQLSVGSATNSTNATNVNVVTTSGAGTSYLAIVSATSGNLPILADTNITVDAATNTITATNFSGIASSATRVGITTSISSSDLPIVFADANQPYAALGSSSLLTYQASTGKITTGIWAGTAITTRGGGTGFNTVNANQVLIGAASGNTWAALGSTLLPVVGIGSNPPAQPGGAIGATQAGQLWWDSEYGVLKIYYSDQGVGVTVNSQWVDATPVLGSSGGASSTKRSYVMTFGAGFTPTIGADSVQIQIPYAPDNTSKYYYIKRLDYRNETLSGGTGASFFIERFTGGNAAFTSPSRIFTAGAGAGSSFVIGASTYTAGWTLAATGASFVSSSGVAGSVISGDYLRLNFTTVGSAAAVSISMIVEEQ